MPSIACLEHGANYLVVYIDGLDSSYSYTGRTATWEVIDRRGATEHFQSIAARVSDTSAHPVTYQSRYSISSGHAEYVALEPNRGYYIRCTINGIRIENGTRKEDLSKLIYTAPPIPVINSFSVYQTQVGTKAANCIWELGNTSSMTSTRYKIEVWDDITEQYFEKATGTFSGSMGSAVIQLNDFKAYTALLTIYNDSNTSGETLTSLETASYNFNISERAAITPWVWNNSNGNASQSQTVNAYNAVSSGLRVSNFSYIVWNDLVEKVREAMVISENGVNYTYNTYLDNALMYANNRTLTAEKFNLVRQTIGGALISFNSTNNAIKDHYNSTESWNMLSGEKVLGAYIKALTTQLNSWINNYNNGGS